MITRILKTIWEVDRPGIVTHLDRCCHTIHRRSTCSRCVDVCPTGALVFDEGLKLDLNRCRECGACTSACPTAALEVRSPSDDDLLVEINRAVTAGRPVVFACTSAAPGVTSEQAVLVPCLKRVHESIILAGLALGAPAVRILDLPCEACQFGGVADAMAEAIARVATLVEGTPFAGRVSLTTELPPATPNPARSGPGPSRRDFFRMVARQGARVGSESLSQSLGVEPTPRETEADQALPARRKLMLKAARKLGSAIPQACDSTGLWRRLSIEPSCNGCTMCARFCPTGALAVIKEPDRVALTFTPSRCVDCGLCEEVCHASAIKGTHAASRADLACDEPQLLVERPAEMSLADSRNERLIAAVRLTLNLSDPNN